eukprot:1153944-Pelagomonas_calceolata.AAC.3
MQGMAHSPAARRDCVALFRSAVDRVPHKVLAFPKSSQQALPEQNSGLGSEVDEGLVGEDDDSSCLSLSSGSSALLQHTASMVATCNPHPSNGHVRTLVALEVWEAMKACRDQAQTTHSPAVVLGVWEKAKSPYLLAPQWPWRCGKRRKASKPGCAASFPWAP